MIRRPSRQPVVERYARVGYNYRMTDIQAVVTNTRFRATLGLCESTDVPSVEAVS